MFPVGRGLDMEARGHEMGKNWAVFAARASYVTEGGGQLCRWQGGASKQPARRPQGFNAIICSLSLMDMAGQEEDHWRGQNTEGGDPVMGHATPTPVGAR